MFRNVYVTYNCDYDVWQVLCQETDFCFGEYSSEKEANEKAKIEDENYYDPW